MQTEVSLQYTPDELNTFKQLWVFPSFSTDLTVLVIPYGLK